MWQSASGRRSIFVANPNDKRSNGVIAKELKISEATVRRAKANSGSSHDEPDARVTGADGKS
jgi:hypothetical protein